MVQMQWLFLIKCVTKNFTNKSVNLMHPVHARRLCSRQRGRFTALHRCRKFSSEVKWTTYDMLLFHRVAQYSADYATVHVCLSVFLSIWRWYYAQKANHIFKHSTHNHCSARHDCDILTYMTCYRNYLARHVFAFFSVFHPKTNWT